MECSVCWVSGDKTRLFDALSRERIVKICESCASKEGMPVVRRPTTFQLKKAEEKSSFRRPINGETKEKEVDQTEVTLKEIVNRNYEKNLPKEKKPRPDLIDNFHWIIMRARRSKKITQDHLAEQLSEATAAIQMAEKGILPDDDYRLVSKLEGFLGINLLKGETRKRISSTEPVRILKMDSETLQNLKLADLQRMKEARESIGGFGDSEEESFELTADFE